MKIKKGFLLIELMVGLTISIFLLVTMAHYIIDVKNKQYKALKSIEAMTANRNEKEKKCR